MKTVSDKLVSQKDKTFILTLIIPQSDIKNEHQKVLQKVARDFEMKGFRKGKAPLDIVEQNVSPSKILEEVVEVLVSKKYSERIKENNLKPIITPQFKFLNPPLTLAKDWQVELTGCETPEVSLDPKYQDKIKTNNNTKTAKEKKTKEQQTNEILDILIKDTKIVLPPVLIDSEVSHRLSRLVEQISQSGLSLEQYFKSQDSTLEKFKQDQAVFVAKEWTLNLILDKIASDLKVEVTPDDVSKIAANYPKGARLDLNLLSYVIRQQKTLDQLLNL